jgi:hypothetical protein
MYYQKMSDNVQTLKPLKVQEYTAKQSKYEVRGKLPSRSVILGPSACG